MMSEADAAMPGKTGGMSEVCVPLASLAEEGADEKSANPAVGDPVDFSATGTVSRIEGGNAYVTLESVNGEPLPENQEPSEPDEASILAMAAAADDQPSTY